MLELWAKGTGLWSRTEETALQVRLLACAQKEREVLVVQWSGMVKLPRKHRQIEPEGPEFEGLT